MKTLKEVKRQQTAEAAKYKKIALAFTEENFKPQKKILGVLLTGSTARGDARKGPYGFMIDLTIVVKRFQDINLDEVLGEDCEPDIPYHCVQIPGGHFLEVELVTMETLNNIRRQPESAIFAKNESIIIFDKHGELKKWKDKAFIITEKDKKERALSHHFRMEYLLGDYRYEKWVYRQAWLQLAQICNEACECYCNFLYCINGFFIPRKDWLTYLTHDMKFKHPKHNNIIEEIYTAAPTEADVVRRVARLRELRDWMKGYCKEKKWL
jgi:predicted nucleotidyltransferase